MLTRFGSIAAALMLATLRLSAAQYPMEGGDLRRSGHALSPTALTVPLDIQWSTQMCLDDAVTNPVVMDSTLVVATRTGLYCMRRSDGLGLWKWSSYGFGIVWNAPAYDPDRDRLYVTTTNGLLIALDAATGQPQWMRNEGEETGCGNMAAAIYYNGRILYKNAKRDWVCLDADSHAVLWRYTMQAPQYGGTPSLDGGLLYLAGTKGEMACLNWSDGSTVWVRQNGWTESYPSALVLSDTHIYAMVSNGKLECRSRSDGSLVWSYQTQSYANGSPSFDGTTVFCSSDDRCIYALDPLTGALKWQRCHAGNFARSAPFTCGGLVFSSGCTGAYYGDNAATGTVDWQATHGADNSFNDWAAADGYLFVSNRLGKVYCFRSGCPGCTSTPTPSPSPTWSATPSATPTASPSATLTATPSPSLTMTLSATASATASATLTASPSLTVTLSASMTRTFTASPTISPTPSITLTGTAVPPTVISPKS